MRTSRTPAAVAVVVAVALIGAVVITGGCRGKRGSKADMKDSAADLRAAVRKTVADPQRAAAVGRAVDDVEAAEAEARSSRAAEVSELRELNADYDATREQFAAVLRRHGDARAGYRDRIAAARVAMIENTTDAEWAKLAKPRAAVRGAATSE